MGGSQKRRLRPAPLLYKSVLSNWNGGRERHNTFLDPWHETLCRKMLPCLSSSWWISGMVCDFSWRKAESCEKVRACMKHIWIHSLRNSQTSSPKIRIWIWLRVYCFPYKDLITCWLLPVWGLISNLITLCIRIWLLSKMGIIVSKRQYFVVL